MKEETDITWPVTQVRPKRRTIHHTWIKQDGFKVTTCSTCGITRRFNDRYGRHVYEDRHHVFSLRSPNCSLPNTKI